MVSVEDGGRGGRDARSNPGPRDHAGRAGVQLAPAVGVPAGTGASDTVRASVSTSGQQANNINGRFSAPAVNGAGDVIAFDSIASNLVVDDTNTCTFAGGPSFPDPGDCPDIFVRDRRLQMTERVSVSSAGIQANSASTDPAISGNGQRVVFFSAATNLINNDTNICPPFFSEPGQCPDIYRHIG